MKHTTTLLAVCSALALVASAGCLGELEPIGPVDDIGNPPPGPDAGGGTNPQPEPTAEAQALFMANVHSALQATCGIGTACHTTTTPTFAVADPMVSYTQVTGQISLLAPGFNAANAKLLDYGRTTVAHKGTVYTPDHLVAIENWLRAELQELDGGVVPTSALARWSGCMDLQEFEDLDVADLWADKNANGQGDCDACHNLGADAFIASNQGVRVFDNITSNPLLMASYFTLDAAGTGVVINRARLESVGLQQPPHQGHGGFNVDGNAYEALEAFRVLTQARMDLVPDACGPPRFPTN